MKQSTLMDIFIFIVILLLAFLAVDTDSIICWLFAMIAAVLAVGIDIHKRKE